MKLTKPYCPKMEEFQNESASHQSLGQNSLYEAYYNNQGVHIQYPNVQLGLIAIVWETLHNINDYATVKRPQYRPVQ